MARWRTDASSRPRTPAPSDRPADAPPWPVLRRRPHAVPRAVNQSSIGAPGGAPDEGRVCQCGCVDDSGILAAVFLAATTTRVFAQPADAAARRAAAAAAGHARPTGQSRAAGGALHRAGGRVRRRREAARGDGRRPDERQERRPRRPLPAARRARHQARGDGEGAGRVPLEVGRRAAGGAARGIRGPGRGQGRAHAHRGRARRGRRAGGRGQTIIAGSPTTFTALATRYAHEAGTHAGMSGASTADACPACPRTAIGWCATRGRPPRKRGWRRPCTAPSPGRSDGRGRAGPIRRLARIGARSGQPRAGRVGARPAPAAAPRAVDLD